MAVIDRNRRRERNPALDRPAPPRPPLYEEPVDYELPVHPGTDWRREVMGWSGLNVLAGIWLIISPFVLDYGARDAMWNPIVFGAIVCVLALVRFGGAFRASVLSWINAAIGVWLFISAWWLAWTMRASWNVGIMGVIVFVLAVLSASATDAMMMRRRV
jgi:SPW repeat-containing protein